MENKSSQTATEVNTYSLWVHLPRHQGQQVCIRHGNGAICFLIWAETQKQRLITKTQTYLRDVGTTLVTSHLPNADYFLQQPTKKW